MIIKWGFLSHIAGKRTPGRLNFWKFSGGACPQTPLEVLAFGHQFHRVPPYSQASALLLQKLMKTLRLLLELGLQSKQVKRSSHEWINKFIIANLISVIISIICSSEESCEIQIKPQFKAWISFGILLASGPRPAWEFHGFTDLHNLS